MLYSVKAASVPTATVAKFDLVWDALEYAKLRSKRTLSAWHVTKQDPVFHNIHTQLYWVVRGVAVDQNGEIIQ